jgi:CRISPR/Cas system CSM-associated protein Csm3 (group 7 of RAMP superfamily)
VPEGTKFKFTVTFKCLMDGEDKLFDKLLEGLKLLELRRAWRQRQQRLWKNCV